ncbi:peptidase S8, partial [Streptomyces sp. MCAF7]
MAHHRPAAQPGIRRRRALAAVPAGLALTASLVLLPQAASAIPRGAPTSSALTSSAAADGPSLSYVVNTAADHGTVGEVKKAITASHGTVVTAYERIGVIIAHSKDPAFAKTIRQVRGVQSAGATRTAPLTPAATTEVGRPEKVPSPRTSATTAAKALAAGQEPLESLQWD